MYSTSLLEKFGFPIAIAIIFALLAVWIVKVAITHILTTTENATKERKDITTQFTTVVSNHIAHNTQALTELLLAAKEARRDHDEFRKHIPQG